jgi:hypothetical protein
MPVRGNAGRVPTVTSTFVGALGGNRTPNLLIRSQMLYPLSYERRLRVSESSDRPRSDLCPKFGVWHGSWHV